MCTNSAPLVMTRRMRVLALLDWADSGIFTRCSSTVVMLSNEKTSSVLRGIQIQREIIPRKERIRRFTNNRRRFGSRGGRTQADG